MKSGFCQDVIEKCDDDGVEIPGYIDVDPDSDQTGGAQVG